MTLLTFTSVPAAVPLEHGKGRAFPNCNARHTRQVQCQAKPDTGYAEHDRVPNGWVANAAIATAVLSGASLAAPRRTLAHESKPWMPRRHYRGIKEERTPPAFQRVQVEHGHMQPFEDVKSTFSHVSERIQGAFSGSSYEDGFTMRKSSTSKPGQVTLKGMGGPVSPMRQVQAQNNVPAWVPFLAAALFIVVAFWGRIRSFFTGGSSEAKGRWIRDRSLGGKMVFIPDDEVAARSSGSTSALPDVPARSRTAAQSVQGASYARTAQVPTSTAGRPSWWVYTPPLPVSATTQQECKKRAKRILKQLENQKLVDGKDYDMLLLIQLYQTCKEGNVDIASSVATGAGREAMLRHAAHSLMAAAQPAAPMPAIMHPRHFICGLAQALGVEEERTVIIVHAIVAAHVRSLLLAIAASKRSNEEHQAEKDLDRVIAAVKMFPLSGNAPEAELVAAAVRDKVTMVESEAILKQLAAKAPEFMQLFTVMLGFDVDLTLPMLQQLVAEQGTS